jgi:hypothetical protein
MIIHIILIIRFGSFYEETLNFLSMGESKGKTFLLLVYVFAGITLLRFVVLMLQATYFGVNLISVFFHHRAYSKLMVDFLI